MFKTTVKRKHLTAKRKTHARLPKSDLDKIKSFLKETTQNWQDTAGDKFNKSVENVKEKGAEVHDYLAERPIKAMGVTLASGLALGICIGYFISNNR